jgi:hypothetical protein
MFIGNASVSRDASPSCHRTDLYSSDDGDFTEGGLGWNRTWTGVYGLLQMRKVDGAYIPITMTPSKLDVVDFSVPVIEMRYKYWMFKNFEPCAVEFVHQPSKFWL